MKRQTNHTFRGKPSGRLRRQESGLDSMVPSRIAIGPCGEVPIIRLHCERMEFTGKGFELTVQESQLRKLSDVDKEGGEHITCSLSVDGLFNGDVIIEKAREQQ